MILNCPMPRQSDHGPSSGMSTDSAATRDGNTAETGPDAHSVEVSSRGSRGLDNGHVYLAVQ